MKESIEIKIDELLQELLKKNTKMSLIALLFVGFIAGIMYIINTPNNEPETKI
jgi:hypothetical protein